MSKEPKVIAGNSTDGLTGLQLEFDAVIRSSTEIPRAPSAGTFLAPGFVDVQVNGFAGVDYNNPDTQHHEISVSIRKMFETGVTKFFPTIITGPKERIIGALRRLIDAKREFQRNHLAEAQAVAGFHIEGPHISPEEGPRGAHPREHVRPPDFEEFCQWQEAADGEIKLITISPEYPTAPQYISQLVQSGVVVSIGHTGANADQIKAAADAGATMSTHLGNGAHTVLPKTSNYIWEQLAEDRLTASLILDGTHLPEAFLRSALRIKGVERSILVTDAVMPAMCEPGMYRLGEIQVELLPDGRVVVPGATRLAGSGLTMDRAIGTCVRFGGVMLADAIRMASINPAIATRMPARDKGLVAGETADIVRFHWDAYLQILGVVETIVAGESVYRAKN
jgi:N-acetylglucosamine-6-phosphate deacetylase